jgi:hypothetical protein
VSLYVLALITLLPYTKTRQNEGPQSSLLQDKQFLLIYFICFYWEGHFYIDIMESAVCWVGDVKRTQMSWFRPIFVHDESSPKLRNSRLWIQRWIDYGMQQMLFTEHQTRQYALQIFKWRKSPPLLSWCIRRDYISKRTSDGTYNIPTRRWIIERGGIEVVRLWDNDLT